MVTLSSSTRRYVLVIGIVFIAYGAAMYALSLNRPTRDISITVNSEEPRATEPAPAQTKPDQKVDDKQPDSGASTDENSGEADTEADSSLDSTPEQPILTPPAQPRTPFQSAASVDDLAPSATAIQPNAAPPSRHMLTVGPC